MSGLKWVWSWSCCHRELVTATLEVEHPVPIVTTECDINYHRSFYLPLRKPGNTGRDNWIIPTNNIENMPYLLLTAQCA